MKPYLSLAIAGVATLALGGVANANEANLAHSVKADPAALDFQPLRLTRATDTSADGSPLARLLDEAEQPLVLFEMRGHYLADGSLHLNCDLIAHTSVREHSSEAEK
jgi:hypothetical protein